MPRPRAGRTHRTPLFVTVGATTVLVALVLTLGARGLIHFGTSSSPHSGPSPPTPTASLQQVIARAQDAAVTFDTSTLDKDFFGSGFAVARGGVVLTDAHVVDHAFRLIAVDRHGGRHEARVVGLDNLHDIALVRVAGFDAVPLTLDTSPTDLNAGTQVYVVGNPGGDHPASVVSGLISAAGRDEGVVEGRDYHDVYQLDTANLVGGSSGSPVMTADGRVIGVDALGDASSDTAAPSSRFAYAIPNPVFRDEVNSWIRNATPIPIATTDLPWQTDPRQAVTQLGELRTGYTLSSQAPATFSPGATATPSDEVTYRLPGAAGSPGRSVFTSVIVYPERADAKSNLDSKLGDLTGTGTEGQPPMLGDDSHTVVDTAVDGTDLVSVLWRDRNVLCLVQFQGLTGSAAVSVAVSLALDVEHRVAASPTLTP